MSLKVVMNGSSSGFFEGDYASKLFQDKPFPKKLRKPETK